MTKNNTRIPHACPHCGTNTIETVATAPYIRGLLLAYQLGSVSFIGCAPCVRKKVLAEAGRSSLLGWFSVTAAVINPVLILYNVLHVPLIRTDYVRARKKLEELGVPEAASSVDLTYLAYVLAANMIKADGKIEAAEIDTAISLGRQLLPDFVEDDFLAVLRVKDRNDPAEIACMLKDLLTEDGKKAIYMFLWSIADADGNVDQSELDLLLSVANNLGLEPQITEAA